MDLNQPAGVQPAAQPLPAVPGPSRPGRMPSTLLFAAGVLFFLLPFLDIQCNGVSLVRVSGLNLATGFELAGTRAHTVIGSMQRMMPDEPMSRSYRGDTHQANPYAVSALLAGVLGLLLSFLKFRGSNLLAGLLGAGAALSLAGLMVDIHAKVGAQIGRAPAGGDAGLDVQVAVVYTPWFYLAILVFAGASYYCLRALRTTPTSPAGPGPGGNQ
ncbi:MAG TPA: hypothetical protein VG870_05000 [Chitinophagaceae bacterium]|nr:hypothetical protein [Chitinophagaceae bacterium]